MGDGASPHAFRRRIRAEQHAAYGTDIVSLYITHHKSSRWIRAYASLPAAHSGPPLPAEASPRGVALRDRAVRAASRRMQHEDTTALECRITPGSLPARCARSHLRRRGARCQVRPAVTRSTAAMLAGHASAMRCQNIAMLDARCLRGCVCTLLDAGTKRFLRAHWGPRSPWFSKATSCTLAESCKVAHLDAPRYSYDIRHCVVSRRLGL